MKKLVFVRERPLGPLVVVVNELCVVGEAFIVADVLVQRIPIVSCMERKEKLGNYSL